jgi:hypothetical protein
VAALLLIVSTFGRFSFVEAAIVLTAGGVLALLRKRADRKRFHLPSGDGTVIFAAGLWSGLLIVVRLFDRPLGQSVLALACAAILAGAGARERAKRPADDLPPLPRPRDRGTSQRGPGGSGRESDSTVRLDPNADLTEQLAPEDAPTERRPARPSARRPRPPRDGREDAPPPPSERP